MTEESKLTRFEKLEFSIKTEYVNSINYRTRHKESRHHIGKTRQRNRPAIDPISKNLNEGQTETT